ncbi:hypothetical protein HID58_080955 [Brassica napus]|uniref:Uncharacterized protein n=1 Tax=Brassica napus TaxID=3708 RepID=A0ABQ7Y7N7_BRANA|nr:hypothetical protein HID58_080955 [Brassica napus]
MEVHPHDESFDLQEIHRARVRHHNCIDESGESIPCGFEALAQDYALQLETKVKEIVEDYCHVDSMDVEECVAVGVTRGYEILAPPRGDDHPHSVVALALFQSVVDRGGDVFVVLIVSNHRFLAEFFRLQSNDLEF